MAKPKEKVGQLSLAFQEKCSKEKEKLRKKLAKQLQIDLQRMLEEQIHTDLEFHLKGGNSVGHKLILKARVRSLWDRLCEGRIGDQDIFRLTHLDQSVFEAYIHEVYTSDCANIASEELQLAMERGVLERRHQAMEEGPGRAMGGVCQAMGLARGQAVETGPYISDLQGGQGGASSGTDPFHPVHPSDSSGGALEDGLRHVTKESRGARLISDCDRYSLESLDESGERNPGDQMRAVCALPKDQTVGTRKGDDSQLVNSHEPDIVEWRNNPDFSETHAQVSDRGGIPNVGGAYPSAESCRSPDHTMYQGAYSLDMIPPTHFAAGRDFLEANPSALFVLPNGQEINNNDANNNGFDANLPTIQNQNIPMQVQSPLVVNLLPQLADLIPRPSKLRQERKDDVPVSLLADIQQQGQGTSLNGSAAAHATLPDLIKTSYCTVLPHDTCSVLGQDLLRVFLQEVECDCTIAVADQEFRCHRCILAARSSYFTAMLGGAWSESDADKIVLEGVSPSAVEQALLYIYGGVVDVMDSCSISELVLLSDMYGLDGLKDIINFNIRMDNCHFFHKPCAACINGVPEALTITTLYGMAELQERCMKWINKNMTKVWPTKSFSLLPQETLDKCCQSAILDLSPDTVLDVIMDCDKLTSSLPRLKWTEPILNLVTLLMDSAMEFTSQHFTKVVASDRFLMLGKSMAWSMSLLDSIFTSVIKSLPVDHICMTYLSLYQLSTLTKDKNCSWTEDFQSFVTALLEKCESYVKVYIHQVIHTKDWDRLSKDIQNNLLEAASYVCIDTNRGKCPPKLSSMNKSGPRPRPVSSQPGQASKSTNSLRNKPFSDPRAKSGDKNGVNSLGHSHPQQVHPQSSQRQEHHGKERPGQRSNTRPGAAGVEIQSSRSNRSTDVRLAKKNDGGSGAKTAGSGYNSKKWKSPGSTGSGTSMVVNRPDDPVECSNDTHTGDLPCDTSLMKSRSTEGDEKNATKSRSQRKVQGHGVTSPVFSSSRSESAIPIRKRSGSTGDVPVPLPGVSRSRSEDLHLRSRADNSVLQLLPIFETKFTLPSQRTTDLDTVKF